MSHIGIVYWSLPALHASRPMRARELKLVIESLVVIVFLSRPMRARELKPYIVVDIISTYTRGSVRVRIVFIVSCHILLYFVSVFLVAAYP